jgi:hypothetical protein
MAKTANYGGSKQRQTSHGNNRSQTYHGYKKEGSGSNMGASTGLKVTAPGQGLRKDCCEQPTNRNPYPNGLA